MTDAPHQPGDTREYAARWHNIVEEHLATRLAGILQRLARAEADGDDVGARQCAALARHVAHALHVAASPGGGMQAAVDYLEALAPVGNAGADAR